MIQIIQTCDVCEKKRNLDLSYHATITSAAMVAGWREVRDNRHMCNNCIREMVGE